MVWQGAVVSKLGKGNVGRRGGGDSGRECEGGSMWTYDVNLRTVSKIRLGVIMCSSLRWLCEVASVCMWNHSIVLRCGPFL
jgi:hypothetical protein